MISSTIYFLEAILFTVWIVIIQVVIKECKEKRIAENTEAELVAGGITFSLITLATVLSVAVYAMIGG